MKADVAVIIVKIDLASQTAAIAPTTIVTPSVDTDYRVSARFTVNASFFPSVSIIYTDESGQRTESLGLINHSNGTLKGILPLRAKAGTAVQYRTDGDPNNGNQTGTYNLFLIVEEL